MNYGEENRKYSWKCQHGLGESFLSELPSNCTVLDLGCGMGELSNTLEASGYTVSRVDGADHCVEYVRSCGHECVQVDLETDVLPFADETFDLVMSLDVIEHLWNVEHYLCELKRVVKDGGHVILTTPNYNCIKYRGLSAIGKFENYGTHTRHKRFYTLWTFIEKVSPFFEIVDVKAVPVAILKSRTISHWMNLWGSQVGILGKKRAGNGK